MSTFILCIINLFATHKDWLNGNIIVLVTSFLYIMWVSLRYIIKIITNFIRDKSYTLCIPTLILWLKSNCNNMYIIYNIQINKFSYYLPMKINWTLPKNYVILCKPLPKKMMWNYVLQSVEIFYLQYMFLITLLLPCSYIYTIPFP